MIDSISRVLAVCALAYELQLAYDTPHSHNYNMNFQKACL